MKILIVEDDFVSRKVLNKMLSSLGESDIAIDGNEALKAFENALNEKQPYDLVCLDIMLPEIDGHTVLKKIRELEERNGIGGLDGAKIIMTTAMGEKEHILKAFQSGCEGYLVKPIDRHMLLNKISELGLK